MIKINIEEGDILVNSTWVSLETPSLIIIEIDTKSKYPELSGYTGKEFWLTAGERTLHKGTDPRPTKIELELPEGFCLEATRLGRYSVEVYCVNQSIRLDQLPKMIWEKKDDDTL
jgi:hypothetical protein